MLDLKTINNFFRKITFVTFCYTCSFIYKFKPSFTSFHFLKKYFDFLKKYIMLKTKVFDLFHQKRFFFTEIHLISV